MLVLSRKVGQDIVIGENIRVTVNRVGGNRVTLGISAPDDVRVVRGELEVEEGLESSTEVETDEADQQVDQGQPVRHPKSHQDPVGHRSGDKRKAVPSAPQNSSTRKLSHSESHSKLSHSGVRRAIDGSPQTTQQHRGQQLQRTGQPDTEEQPGHAVQSGGVHGVSDSGRPIDANREATAAKGSQHPNPRAALRP